MKAFKRTKTSVTGSEEDLARAADRPRTLSASELNVPQGLSKFAVVGADTCLEVFVWCLVFVPIL